MGKPRFRATIEKQGLNSYVDVPERVSAAFAPLAQAGRISVRGRLNRTDIRGTLVPVRGKRHRLYVNGGMRSAAGVAVGDTVSFQLTAVRPEDVRAPRDVAAGLRRVKGALATFRKLPPSHRRELLRFIDEARTPETRQRRIAQTADHVLGHSRPMRRPAPAAEAHPLWICPKCGNQFVTRNMFHSCRRYDLDALFRGKPPEIRALFDRFRAMVESFGPVKVLPYRDKVGFMVRVRFAGAVPRRRWLEIGFWVRRRLTSPRFTKVETMYPNAHVHRLHITDPKELDGKVRAWVKEAYAVGCQEKQPSAFSRQPPA